VNFDCFNFDPRIISGVNALGYTQPTPIQQEAIPPILAGRDVMGIAQTGTGKTAAFVLPILQRLMPGRRSGVRALVIAPTRELTEQTLQSTRQLGRKTGLTCVSIYGGAGMQSQVDALRRGVDIVSACPGRLLDHVRRKTINLSQVEVLVLDEADQMFDMGFLPDIRAILKHLPSGRQTLLFSATMPPEIDALAGDTLRDPVRVQIGRPAPAATVSHTFCPVETQAKNSLLQQILNTAGTGLVLVFTRTKQRSKRVAQQLEASGFEAAALHGNLSQNNRQRAIEGFRAGRYKILVATDIAARGIDVCGVSHVINYDIPATADAYTHRIGRTGRACATGEAITFVGREDQGLAREIGKLIGGKLKVDTSRPAPALPPDRTVRPSAPAARPFGVHRRPGGSRNRDRFRPAVRVG